MPSDDFTPTPGLEVDGYRLVRFLGRGGFGEVWLCRSGATGSHHAIKFISGADPELLEKEHHSLTLYRADEAAATSRDVQRIAEKVRARLQQAETGASPVDEA